MGTYAPEQPLRVLLVENDEGFLEVFAAVLSALSYTVYTATTVTEALSVVPTFRPDAIFVLVRFTVGVAVELCAQFRRMPEAAMAVIVAITLYGVSRDDAHMLTAFDKHLVMPVQLATLLESLDCLEGYKGSVVPLVRLRS